jgi:hypothetical protein
VGYRIVRMSKELFAEFFTEGWTVPNRDGERVRCVKGLPEGAKLEAVSNELYLDTGDIALKFSHPSWPDQLTGHAIPLLDVQYNVEAISPSATDPPLIVTG